VARPTRGNPSVPGARINADLNRPCDESKDFLERARVFWEGRTGRPLTREDAREIMGNLTGFFQVLSEWDQADRMEKKRQRTSDLASEKGN
jgi:hypothetical protein